MLKKFSSLKLSDQKFVTKNSTDGVDTKRSLLDILIYHHLVRVQFKSQPTKRRLTYGLILSS